MASPFSCKCMPALFEMAHGFATHNSLFFSTRPISSFRLNGPGAPARANVSRHETTTSGLSRSAGPQRAVSPPVSCSTLCRGTNWHASDHERYPVADPTWRGIPSPGCFFSCRRVHMPLMPTPIRKPSTLMQSRPSEVPSAYRPAFAEKRSATITLVGSLKMAPLRRSWLLVSSQVLAPPREAQLRSAPRRSVLSRKAPRRSTGSGRPRTGWPCPA